MSMRDEFEAWAKESGYALLRTGLNQYFYTDTSAAWDAWQAARSQGEPVAWWDGDTGEAETAFQFEQDSIYNRPVYTHPAQPGDGVPESHVVIHEYTARMALVALKDYTFRIRQCAGPEPEPEEHYYGVRAIEDLESALPQPPKREESAE